MKKMKTLTLKDTQYEIVDASARTDISELKGELYGDSYFESIGDTYYKNDGTKVSSNGWHGLMINVSTANLDGYVVVSGILTSYETLVKSYVFLDENKSELESSTLSLVSPSLKIPTNAKILILNSYSGNFKVKHPVILDDIEKIKSDKFGLIKIPCIKEQIFSNKK